MADITVRKMAFEWPDDLAALPRESDPIGSCELIGLSFTLPYLEPYLIRTMRVAAKSSTDPELVADIKAFSAQEAFHHRNHSRINNLLRAKLNPSISVQVRDLETRLDADYQRFTKEKSAKFNLAYAEGFEAMTLCIALINMERGFDDVDEHWARLIEWHLCEEIEHRTVTFDAYDKLHGGYLYRVVVGTWAQLHFLGYLFRLAECIWRDSQPQATTNPWASKLAVIKRQWQSGLLPRMLKAIPPWYNPAKTKVPHNVTKTLAKYDDLAAA